MTTITTNPFASWRTEIANELDEARKALTAVEAELAEASTKASEAAAAHRDLLAALAPVTSPAAGFARVALAPAITLRLSQHKQVADTASGRRVRAHGERGELLRKIANLEQALAQLDMVLAPAAQEDAA